MIKICQFKCLYSTTILVAIALPTAAQAQSVSDCLHAQANETIELCSAVLAANNQTGANSNASVYYKLASELYQQDQASEALEVLTQGLQDFPADASLQRLQRYINLDKNGIEPSDTTPATTIPTKPGVVSKGGTDRGKLIFEIQTTLNQLGFDAGSPDGIAGKLTQRALSGFYRKSELLNAAFEQNSTIDSSVLKDLREAEINLHIAQQLFTKSQQAFDNEAYNEAQSTLEQALATSRLFSAPEGYQIELSSRRVAAENTTPAQPETPAVVSPAVASINSLATPANLQTLLREISDLDAVLNKWDGDLEDSMQMLDKTSAEVQF